MHQDFLLLLLLFHVTSSSSMSCPPLSLPPPTGLPGFSPLSLLLSRNNFPFFLVSGQGCQASTQQPELGSTVNNDVDGNHEKSQREWRETERERNVNFFFLLLASFFCGRREKTHPGWFGCSELLFFSLLSVQLSLLPPEATQTPKARSFILDGGTQFFRIFFLEFYTTKFAVSFPFFAGKCWVDSSGGDLSFFLPFCSWMTHLCFLVVLPSTSTSSKRSDLKGLAHSLTSITPRRSLSWLCHRP